MNRIGKYDIISKIGQGGMGAVYKAKHPTLRRMVILKQLIIKKSPSIIERFKREARIMLDLRNDRIVQVFDHFREGNSYFIGMEYVDGIPLDKLIKEKRYLSNEAAILIFIEICKGLKYAHDRHVIHRDIKPANILISRDGEVKITDFGIATSKEDEGSSLTKEGATLGSPAFMAPEQIYDAKTVDKKADIYSMGVVLYNMVTGKLPFPTNISPETITKIEKGKYIKPKKINPRIKKIIQKVINKSMKSKKNARFSDLGKVIRIFDKFTRRFKNQKEINETIKDYIHGKDIPVKKLKPKMQNIISMPIKILFFSLILASTFYLFFNEGLYYKLIRANEYGATKIVIEIQREYKVKPKLIDVEIYDNDTKIKDYKLKNINLVFNENKAKSTGGFIYFESQKIFLKSNRYKISANINNKRYEYLTFINPINKQISDENIKDAEIIKFKYDYMEPLPLKINFNFFDISKNDIIDGVNVKVKSYNTWIGWDNYLQGNNTSITTNKTYQFQFTKDGYLPNYLTVNVPPYQNNLYLTANLALIPGKLVINLKSKELRLLINGSNYYYTGGNDRKYLKIQPSAFDLFYNNIIYIFTEKEKGKNVNIQLNLTKKQEISLSPSEYSIEIKKSNEIKKNLKVNINSNRTTFLDIDFNKKTKSIEYIIK